MTRHFVPLVVAMMLCSLALGESRKEKEHKKEMSREEQAITNEARSIDQSIMSSDTTALRRMVPENWTLINHHGRVLTRDQFAEEIQTGELKALSLQRLDDEVRVLGNTAVESGILTVRGQEAGRDISGQYRFTNVWHQRDGRWEPVTSQLTAISPETAGARQSGAEGTREPSR